MEYWFDVGMAVLLGVIESRKQSPKQMRALSKLLFKLTHLKMMSPTFAAAYESYVKEKGEI